MMGRSGSRMGSGGCLASQASSGAWMRPNCVGRRKTAHRDSPSAQALACRISAAHRSSSGSTSSAFAGGQVEDEPGDAGVAIALDQVEVLGDAEDGDRKARRIAARLDRHLPEVGQEARARRRRRAGGHGAASRRHRRWRGARRRERRPPTMTGRVRLLCGLGHVIIGGKLARTRRRTPAWTWSRSPSWPPRARCITLKRDAKSVP